MKIVFTAAGGSAATLGEDAVKHAIEIESWGGQSIEQVVPLARAANPLRLPRGNVSGDFAFVAAKSHASVDAAASFFAGEYARLNQSGSLVLTVGTHTITMAGAVLRGVAKANIIGLRWYVRYTFGITTLTYT